MRAMKLIFTAALLCINTAILKAHSVQIAYCVSCNGDLRIFVEHWHGTEDPNSTTMTINLTVNGNPQTQTQPPVTGIINVPFGQLPGCSTPVTSVASCPGNANTYNDWVIYDYFGLPSGVPISFTIISGNTVFTADGCGMYPLTVNFTIPPQVNNNAPVDVCFGQQTPLINVPNGQPWTNSNPGIGLPANGVGPINPFTPTSTGTATITYSNSCGVNNTIINVVPALTASYSSPALQGGVCLGTPVTFTDNSPVASGWQWDFGDGNTSNQQNPTHVYAAPGTYNVQLTVTNGNDCPGTITQAVTIHPLPVPAFVVNPACPNSNVTINNTSNIATGTMNYQWTMTGATPNTSTQTNPSFTYPAGGTYTIDLQITSNQGCVASLSQNVNIPYMPVPDFSFTDECFGTPNSFTDLSVVQNGTITGWTWVWGDGDPVGTTQNPTHLYANPGIYQVTLIPTTNDGCTGPSVTYDVEVYQLPTASFNVSNVCHGQPAIFNNTSLLGSQYQWDFGDGNNSTQENPTHTFATPNTYVVSLTVTSANGCVNNINQNITVYPNPTAAFIFVNECLDTPMQFTDQSNISAGNIVSWAWNFGDNNSSNQTSPQHQYANAGTYNVTLTVTSNDGCVDSITQTVTPYAMPVANFTSNSPCEGSISNFTNQSVIALGTMNYYWDFGNGNFSTQVNPSNLYGTYGTYNVTLTATSDNGCVNTVTLPATVHPNPVVAYSADILSDCSPLCVNFANTSNIALGTITQYDWNFSDGQTASGATPSLCFTNDSQQQLPVTVTLTATSNQGCVSVLTTNNMLTVNPIPVADFSASPQPTTIFEPVISFTDLSYANIASWQWTLGDGNNSTDQNPIHEYAVPGIYDVNLYIVNIYGCDNEITKPVEIKPEFILYVPNTFTPDGNGVNEVFIPVIADFSFDHLRYEFMIFNRWGDQIFYTQNYLVGWDGTHNGQPAKTDTYVWKIKVKDAVSGKIKEFYGHVNLLR